MYYIPYDRDLKEFSRELRKNSTLSEVILWQELKGRKIKGYQFNRQKPIGRYIVDFYCRALSLVIEVDGTTHTWEKVAIKDEKRELVISELGLKILHFDDLEVKHDLKRVLNEIFLEIEEIERTRLI